MTIHHVASVPELSALAAQMGDIAHCGGNIFTLAAVAPKHRIEHVVPKRLDVASVTGINPPVVTTTAAHGLQSGHTVYLSELPPALAEGVYTIKVKTEDSFELVGVDLGDGTWVSGGVVSTALVKTVAVHGLASGVRLTVHGVLGATGLNGLHAGVGVAPGYSWLIDTLTIPVDPATAAQTYEGGGSVVATFDGVPALAGDQFWDRAERDRWDFVDDFGAVGDGVTDCLPAWKAAMAAMGPQQNPDNPLWLDNIGEILTIPKGTYYFSETPHVSRYCMIKGAAPGAQPATMFVVPGGTTGLELDAGTARGSIISQIGFRSDGTGDDPEKACGVRSYATCQLRDLYVHNFRGDLINIRSDEDASNTNDSQIRDCYVGNGGRHGLRLSGYDTSNCTVINVHVDAVGEVGIYNSGFLNNTFIGCHVVDAGSHPYKSTGVGVGQFEGCYAENCVVPSHIEAPSMWTGGNHGFAYAPGNPDYHNRRFTKDSTGWVMPNASEVSSMTIVNDRGARKVVTHLGYAGQKPVAFGYGLGDGSDQERAPFGIAYEAALNVWMHEYGLGEPGVGFAHTAHGHSRVWNPNNEPALFTPINTWYFPKGVGIGEGPDGRWDIFRLLMSRTTPPTSFVTCKGDVVFHADPVYGQPYAWIKSEAHGWVPIGTLRPAGGSTTADASRTILVHETHVTALASCTLELPSTPYDGEEHGIKNGTDTASVIIAGNNGMLIDGYPTVGVVPRDYRRVRYNGAPGVQAWETVA